MGTTSLTTPVLLIGFNRPDDIQQSFDAIRNVRPSKLYVAIDGPRVDRKNETQKVDEVKKIVQNVDWACETFYRFSEKNLGCKGNIPSAISWVLEEEDRVIVVEDDIVAPPSFFVFEEQMLEKYKDDDRIAMVSGNNYTPVKMKEDYLFSMYAGHIWGWGTWKRVWDKFDVQISELGKEVEQGFPTIKKHTRSRRELKYFSRYFTILLNKQRSGTDNFWGPQFAFFRMVNGYLNIVPRVNLASNIGNISSRDMSNNSAFGAYYYPSYNDFKIEHSIKTVFRDEKYDRMHLLIYLDKKSILLRIDYRVRFLISRIRKSMNF